jgi:Asp-tRNA(Asn)/Glu-tRNA(Gln) amidotransferase A subunit family amidase
LRKSRSPNYRRLIGPVELPAHAVIRAHLDRIGAYDKRGPLINSLITVNPRALEEADRLDAALKATGTFAGPLHGIPVIIKDNIDVAGLPMTAGFQGWKNYYPPADATVVKKIRAAGDIVIAKSSLSEFARGSGDHINSVLPATRATLTILHSLPGAHLVAMARLWPQVSAL